MDLQEIRIKRDGKWYADNAEMFRMQIVNLFARNLVKDVVGRFYIELNQETFPVIVEDVPFTAVDAHIDDGAIVFTFHDEQIMIVSEETKLYFKDDTPYVTYRWIDDTRIGRSAYWMVSEYLVERDGSIYLRPPCVVKN
ncbi:MAG: DUF1285 domain-containing protein [Ignavibacteriales bacterium]